MNPNMRKVLLDAPSLMVNGRVRYGQLAQCIALRPVAEGYNGNACTVRRSTDNTSQDVGFLGTELDSFSLMNFVGSENLLLRSEEMDNASWVKSGLTITSNAAIAPDGTLTADLLSNTISAEAILQYVTPPTASIYSYSLYVKSASSDWIRFIVYEIGNTANRLTLWFNPSTGTLGTVSAGGTATLVTGNVVAAANGFYRIYLTGSFVSSSLIFQTNMVTTDSTSTVAYNSARYQWGAQVNQGTLQDYSRTVASPRLGSQNMLLRSEEMGDTNYWIKADTTVTSNAIVAPDGTTTADLLTEGAAGTAQIYQSTTVVAQKAYTASLYLKYGNHDWIRILFYETSTGNTSHVWVNLTTGALGTSTSSGTGVTNLGTTITNVGNGWYRVTISATFTNTSASLYITSATANNSFTKVNNGTRYQWGAQVNQGSVAAAYQKTVATTTEWGANQNLVTYSEGAIARYATAINVTDAATSISGYAASVQFGDNSVERTLYTRSYTPKLGATYTFTLIVQMDDNTAPVPSTSPSSGDFSLVFAGIILPTPTVTSLGSNLYRVTLIATTTASYTIFGLIKYTTQSSKGFRITGIQVNEGSVAQNYIRTLDKAIDVGNGYLTKIYDQSGNARDMSQATAANQPRIVFHGTGEKINGKAAFTTDGASQQLTSTSYVLPQPYTRCGAFQVVTNPATRDVFSDAANVYPILYLTAGAGGQCKMIGYTARSLNIKTGVVAGDKAITAEIYNGASSLGSYNGIVTTGDSGTNSILQPKIGQGGNGYSNVVVGEMIIFPQALSHSDRQTWEATAKQYWSTP
jgi:hypothetical protein